MRLTDLNSVFLKREDSHHFRHVDTIGKADGVMFLCPKCFVANGGAAGTHSIICWAPQVPQDTSPTPGRWKLKGTGLGDLTLKASSSSVLLTGPGCGAHFFVRDGAVVDA